jgi:hypothetical protein
MTRGGLPHSDISGSKLICSSPELFAACHVLHRLLAPRHSPYTLSSLTIRNSKLTLTDSLHISRSATVPCNTACVVVGKNYRLQNIQLSKIRWGPSPHAPGSVARGAPMPHSAPSQGSTLRSLTRWGPKAQLRSLAGDLHATLWAEFVATLKSRTLITSAPRSARRLRALSCGCRNWARLSAHDRDRRRRTRRL